MPFSACYNFVLVSRDFLFLNEVLRHRKRKITSTVENLQDTLLTQFLGPFQVNLGEPNIEIKSFDESNLDNFRGVPSISRNKMNRF